MKFSEIVRAVRRIGKGRNKAFETKPISRDQLKKAAERFSTNYGGVIKDLSRE